jgi:hypothetical protein
MAIQIRGATPVFNSQKNGKAKSSEKAAPNRYTGRRPTRSESLPKRGMVASPMAAAIMTPTRPVL